MTKKQVETMKKTAEKKQKEVQVIKTKYTLTDAETQKVILKSDNIKEIINARSSYEGATVLEFN